MPYYDPRLIMPHEQDPYPPFVWFGHVLSPPECEAIRQLAEAVPMYDGRIGNGDSGNGTLNEDYRKVDTSQLLPDYRVADSNIHWLFERVRDKVVWANTHHYHFDIVGLWQQINYLRYRFVEGEVPGHYDWHTDFGGGTSSQRKLSVVVQLSPPEEYDDCRLLLRNEGVIDPGHIGQGDMIVFPSWTVHSVTPISRGERRALVSWVSGPPFR